MDLCPQRAPDRLAFGVLFDSPFIPLAALVGLILWLRWLWIGTDAPKASLIVPGVCVAVSALCMVSAVYGFWSSFDAIGASGDPTLKAAGLAHGIPLMMISLEVGRYAIIGSFVTLFVWTWRYRAKPTSSKPGPA